MKWYIFEFHLSLFIFMLIGAIWYFVIGHVTELAAIMGNFYPEAFLCFKSSHRNSFVDRALEDRIYGCPIFSWVADFTTR